MKKLFEISTLQIDGEQFTARLEIDPRNAVFDGHFPGMPVVPGVALIEMAAAMAGAIAGQKVSVSGISVVKFLHLVDPRIHPELTVTGNIIQTAEGSWKASMSFHSGETVFAKMKEVIFQVKI